MGKSTNLLPDQRTLIGKMAKEKMSFIHMPE
jgi:hypothetical protein